ncbi:FAD-dependent monooxygenase [Phytohabitans sp. ZYX-F-186]|uniref:FAD-dependent monooxygenase n=1 Tax=Phytohabitans maris TaxID=3071409 RepID=A0ABU0ZF41_9ACTN|nr:FAD-dependent monooxygenase [Phytohabitans sp. ZYX-F-186]MDQ7905667.1 FAD-dependent monooxygenase [Phytohabitans sp. ZYX-F-186]
MRIAVVGAGVGGLVTAACLAREGVRCEVFEWAGGPPEVAGGIQISPNGARILHRLGLEPELRAVAARPVVRELRRWRDGRLIGRVGLGTAARERYGAPYYTLRRTDLSHMLLRAAGPVRFGQRCVGVDESASGVRLSFAGGGWYDADVVVGADGLHSVVRRALATDPPRFAGHTVYRALVPADRLPWPAGPPRVTVWLGPGQHCVSYPVGGSNAVNVVATVAATSPPEGYAIGDAGRLAEAYQGWHPRVRELLAAGPLVHHGLFDRPPPRHWQRGRIALVGDAAHPMLPFLAQGATQAIEDAATLAAHLRDPEGLARYEALRRPRVERVLAAVREGADWLHLPDGPRQRDRDRRLASARLSDQDWLYGWDHPSPQCTRMEPFDADPDDRAVPDADAGAPASRSGGVAC